MPKQVLENRPKTTRQDRFCEEYVVDRNGAQAAIRAGYAKGSARIQASKLLTLANVRERINELDQIAGEKSGLTASLVREEYRRIIVFNPKLLLDDLGQAIEIHKLPDEVAACIASVEYETFVDTGADGEKRPIKVTKLKFWNKNQALSDAAKVTGLMKDKITVDVNPLSDLLQRLSGNGSGLPYNPTR